MKPFVLTIAALAVTLGCFATADAAAPATTVSSATEQAVTARAKDWLHQVQVGKIDRTQLNATMNNLLTDALVQQVSSQLLPLGEPTTFTLTNSQVIDGQSVYTFKVQFKAIALDEFLTLEPGGKISGLLFKPAQP